MCVLREATSDAKAQPEEDGLYLWSNALPFFRSITRLKPQQYTVWNIIASSRYEMQCHLDHHRQHCCLGRLHPHI
jgi:hypothetical protein